MPGSPERYPWDDLRVAYIEGWTLADGTVTWPSFSELMERIYPEGRADHVRRRAGRERWLDQRRVFQAQMEQARREARARELAESTERIDTRALRTAETGLAVVHARLSELARDSQDRLGTNRRGSKSESSEASTLGLAGWRFHVLAMRALGMEGTRSGDTRGVPTEPDDCDGILATDAERRLAEQVSSALAGITQAAEALAANDEHESRNPETANRES